MKNRTTKEIGGYLELDKYGQEMLHEGAAALNCGRNCLAYLIKARRIKKILLPYFICGSVIDTCLKEKVVIRYYRVKEDFHPAEIYAGCDEWVYIVNYYGQLSADEIIHYKNKYKNIIVDNAQAYFEQPAGGADTLYTCRKFFGVPDGAFLYTDSRLDEELEQDESYGRMEFILGRFERPASEFYDKYARNNDMFAEESVKKMSRLTLNLLHGIDYSMVKEKRTRNYCRLHDKLKDINHLKLKITEGAFAYPLLAENGPDIRKKLISEKIYIPVLWPDVLENADPGSIEYRYAGNILPLPCDQRYGESEMDLIAEAVKAAAGDSRRI